MWSLFAVYLLFMFVPIIFPTTSEHKSRGYLIALPKEKKVGMPKHTDFLHSSCFTKSMLFRLTNWVKFSRQFLRLIIKMKFIYILTSEFKKIYKKLMVNENDHIRSLGHISHLTVLFFVLSALNKYEWKKKKKSWNILQELWVFFFPCDCLNSLLLSVSVKSIVRSLYFTLPFLPLYVHV